MNLQKRTSKVWCPMTIENKGEKAYRELMEMNQAPWYVDEPGLNKILELWGLPRPQFEKIKKAYRPNWVKTYGEPTTNFYKAQFEADAVVNAIQFQAANLEMPEVLVDFCGLKNADSIAKKLGVGPENLIWDPVRITYEFLKTQGFDVWIPVD